jgi:two-component system, NtrC family, sensor kinase
MRLYQQLVLFMLAATVLPLAGLGFWLLRSAEGELVKEIRAEQRALAVAAAEGVASLVMGAADAVSRSAMSLDWPHLAPDETDGALRLLYQQSTLVDAVALLSPQGTVRAGPLFFAEGGSGHPGFDPQGAVALVKAIPVASLASGAKGQVAMSPAYLHSSGRMGALALAVKLDGTPGAPFAVAELGLAQAQAALAERATGGQRIDIVDGGGRVVVSSDPARILAKLDVGLWTAAKEHLAQAGAQSFSVSSPERVLVSATPLPDQLGLYAVVTVAERDALAPVWGMRRTVVGSIAGALAVLLLLGGLFTRRLNARIGQVVEGVQAYTRGELAKRIPVSGADELTDLAETFNAMGGELETARGRLMRWNDELKQKVDEATADLRAAQAQLVEAQKLAAVGQLGAGVAHEINNPLAGILGNAQLLMLERNAQDPDFATLQKIELAAKRCKEITQNLLRFSQQRDKPEFRPTDLNAVVRDAISLSANQSKGEGVSISARLQAGTLMVRGDPGHLSQVVLALLSNARIAMLKAAERTLTISTLEAGSDVLLSVEDTGKGIKAEHLPRIFEPFFTTKDVWSNVGLGLSVSYRVVSEHQGKIDVRTELGRGSTFTVRLPKLGEKRA